MSKRQDRRTITDIIDGLQAKGFTVRFVGSSRFGVGYQIQSQERSAGRLGRQLADILDGKDSWFGKA